ncbi:glycogen operon protein [Butyrivibrio hungatei DSM 14810]|uniref:Glycogen operon protein n=1 Tax=Butyrivibrio hungatei DSM 14810 TaxID=1121132 RepID=A0A1M7SLN7_9FIRM|nr:alpha-amylase family glycosyl hydrolase [Butyrivibrio hungatei]SHN59403.1 glycogen operon protein [Butyrivibrio hungatei DSM 14810]
MQANTLKIASEKPYPLGCYIDYDKSLVVRTVFDKCDSCGITLYSSDGDEDLSIELPKTIKRGNIYSARISGIDNIDKYTSYNYFEDDSFFCNSYSKHLIGLESFGKDVPDSDIRAKLDNRSTLKASEFAFDWESDSFPEIPYEDSFVYLMHVRGFTKASSSGVAHGHRGTFMGILDKLPYLKELGVTTIELMPAYEMNEIENPSKIRGNKVLGDLIYSKDGSISNKSAVKPRLNFWGYKKGYYFAPRTAYCADPSDCENEFKTLVKELHKNGIEVIMQFYFEADENESLIIDALRYWRCSYHIDGFHLKGARVPMRLITKEPLFTDAKIWYDGFDYFDIYGSDEPEKRYLAEYNGRFMYNCRRFLKSDDNTASDFMNSMINNGTDHGVINYICDYEGFRLVDMVSYEHKHNEENGENNKDGNDNNLTWNCGIEGRTRKQSILSLRKKQMKNILTMLFMAQGTPMLFSGDEFGNSQSGNNNPYCQDNEIGWVDWKAFDKNKDIYEYIKLLVKIRKENRILHASKPLKLMDYTSCGYPDLSCHGRDAWRPDLSGHSHMLGMLYCGMYDDRKKDSPFVYVCYNMHWFDAEMALPKMPDGYKWELICDTAQEDVKPKEITKELETLPDRSARIYIGSKDPNYKQKKEVRKKK